MLAWDNVPLDEQTLKSFKACLAKREKHLLNRVGLTKVQVEQAFFCKSTPSHSKHELKDIGHHKKPHLTTEEKDKATRLTKLKHRSCCNNCGQKGHFANECPNSTSSDATSPKQSRFSKDRGKTFRKRNQAHITASKAITSGTSNSSDTHTSSSEA